MIIVQTPLRISFFGGGTDFENYYATHGGAVLSTGINKYVFIIIKERFDDKIYINYSTKEIVDSPEEIKHDLIREALKLTNINKGVEITTLADVPAHGSGLGSSSSVTVGMLNALYAYQGKLVTASQLAEEACRIEIDILGTPIGKQDQYIAAHGNMRFITFDKNSIEVEELGISPNNKRILGENLLLFYTGLTSNSNDVLSEQKTKIDTNIETLSKMKELAYEAKTALIDGDIDMIGELLGKSWDLKKQLANKISNNQINEMYEAACKAGAIGGKIAGSGGGGFLLLYCQKKKQEAVRAALSNLRELPIRFENDGSKVIFNYRTVS